MAGGLAALDRAGHLDGAAEQQQLLGERGLAGVRVRDDRERASPSDLGSQVSHGGGFRRPEAPERRRLSLSTAASSRPLTAW